MRGLFFFVAFSFVSGLAISQQAIVIELSRADRKAKSLYESSRSSAEPASDSQSSAGSALVQTDSQRLGSVEDAGDVDEKQPSLVEVSNGEMSRRHDLERTGRRANWVLTDLDLTAYNIEGELYRTECTCRRIRRRQN